MLTESCTFFMPRGGRLECVRAASRDDLVVLRTELEILRQVRDLVRRPLSEARRTELGAPPDDRRFEPGDSDLGDLNHVLHDARSPLIEPMTHLIDQEHPDISAELPMSVISEEARHIARDARRMTENPNSTAASVNMDAAAEAIAATAFSAADGHASTQDPVSTPTHAPVATGEASAGSTALEADLDKALADAESCLQELSSLVDETVSPPTASAAEAVADVSPTVTQSEIVADSTPSAVPSLPAAGDSTSLGSSEVLNSSPPAETPTAPQPEAVSPTTAVAETTEMTSVPTSQNMDAPTPTIAASSEPPICEPDLSAANPEIAVQNPAGDQVDDGSAAAVTIGDAATQPAPIAAPAAHPTMNPTPSALPADDAALHAVQAIESGLLQLAQSLRGEVSQRWRSAQQAFDEVEQRRAGSERMLRETQMLVEELQRTKERIEIARDDIDICRREAAHFREDARRAKERAEASAEAASIAADRSARELEGMIQAKSVEHGPPAGGH